MKSNTNNDVKTSTRIIALCVMIWSAMFISFACNAQENKKQSEWQEVTVSEVPYNVEIHAGVTKNGNPKYWIEIRGMNIAVSESNYNKFINKEVKLVIVEWYNPTTGKYKYTTRQANKNKTNNKLNMDNLW